MTSVMKALVLFVCPCNAVLLILFLHYGERA